MDHGRYTFVGYRRGFRWVGGAFWESWSTSVVPLLEVDTGVGTSDRVRRFQKFVGHHVVGSGVGHEAVGPVDFVFQV